MKRRILIATLGLTLLTATAAQARFIMFDTNFDTRTLGAPLERRGARAGEPIEAQGDNFSEIVVEDAFGDLSLQIWDTTTQGADELTFAWLDGREVVDGKLNISLEIQPDTVDRYEVKIRGENAADPPFFWLQLTHQGRLFWTDGDDVIPNIFDTYGAGDVLRVELAFDLGSGTYDFTLDGVPVTTGEAHGVAGYGIARLVVGNRPDANATGSIRLDDLSVDWQPGTAEVHLLANFNNEPIGEPIGTGGAELGQPIQYASCVPTVENGDLPTPSLLIPDEDDYYTCTTTFEFRDSAELTVPDISVDFMLWFDAVDDYIVYVREQGGASSIFLTLAFTNSGTVKYRTELSGGIYYDIGTYQPQVPIRVEIAYFSDAPLFSLWIDGERLVHGAVHGVLDRGVGRLVFGAANDADYDGRMRVDFIRVFTLEDLATPIDEAELPLLAAPTLSAAPNPFNPTTELRFTLPRAGDVRLDVVDLRGRRVRRVLGAPLRAGDHRATWQGTDDSGRRVASGVYQALLTVDGAVQQRLPLTLVK